jgi:hypothetical protein
MNVKKGDKVIFKGYEETPEDGADLLVEGNEYEVAEVNKEDGSVAVIVDNPDFNPKKKESESNARTILTDIFFEELELPKGSKAKPAAKTPAKGKAKAEEPEDGADEEGEEDADGEDEAEEEPAPKAKTKAPAKTAAKAAPAKGKAKPKAEEPEDEPEEGDEGEDGDEEEPAPKKAAAKKAPAKAAAKTPAKKAAAKSKAPVKSKAKAKAKEEEAEESDDPYGDLDEEQEDQEILGLVNDAEDILELARETVEETSALEYKLGGVLFHVRKSGAYKELDERYAEKGGFALYLLEQLNIEYRKAMYLVDIYYKWNKFGLEPEKVAQIGWAKAAKIAAVMDEDTAEELIELAENNTVADLVDHIKTTYKEVGGTKGEKKVIKLFKFKLAESAGIAVEEVLQSVAAGMGLKNLDEAFEHIVMEWSTEHPIEAPAKKVSGKAATKQTNGKARSKA